MSISKGKMRLDRPISQIHNWGLHPRYLSNSLCTDAPPPLRKNQGERRLCSGKHLRKLFCLFSLWQLKRCWQTNTTLVVPFFPRSPVPLVSPVLLVPLFLLFSWSPHSLFPLVPLVPLLPCYPVPPIPLVTLFLLFPSFPCFLFSLFLFFPCSLVSPVSLVLLVPLFPLLPLFSCSPCSPVPLVPLCVFFD